MTGFDSSSSQRENLAETPGFLVIVLCVTLSVASGLQLPGG